MQVLVLEASTSSAKAMVYGSPGGLVRLCAQPYSGRASDGYTHDARAVYAALLEAGRQAAQGQAIDGISLVGTWHTTLVCDQKLQPCSRVYLWTSAAAAETAARVRGDAALTRRLYEATGCMAHAMYPLYHIRYLQESGQAKGEHFFSTEDAYFFHEMTGDWRISRSSASGSGLLKLETLTYDKEALAVAGVDEGQLAPLCDHTHTAPLGADAARALGLPAGIPVCAANPDGAMNQLGSAALHFGDMTLSVGTSAAVRMLAEAPDVRHQEGCWLYYAPTHYLAGAATGATNNLDWFVRNFAPGEGFAALEGSALLPDSPHYLPFLYGERCPGWDDRRRAQFWGMQGRHTVKNLYAAVEEGIAHNLCQCYQRLCAAHGAPGRIFLSGGILKSAVWSQMLADVLNRELLVSETDQASLLGGAAIALHALGVLPALDRFCPDQKAPRSILPNPEKRELYQARFAQYLHIYSEKD